MSLDKNSDVGVMTLFKLMLDFEMSKISEKSIRRGLMQAKYVSQNHLAEIERLKHEIDQFRPFSAHTVSELRGYFRIGMTWSSNAIEGNTLTESETKAILEDGLTIGGKAMREHLEALGHADAFDAMWTLAVQARVAVSDVCFLHQLFYARIDSAGAGTFRAVPVLITGTDYLPPAPDQIPARMQSMDDWFTGTAGTLHPVERAIQAHIELVNIHPFIDGNGRTARLLLNVILMQHGYAITLVPPVLRAQYIRGTADANKGNVVGFYKFMAERIIESQREYLRLVKSLSGSRT